jgi:hypothetical protein
MITVNERPFSFSFPLKPRASEMKKRSSIQLEILCLPNRESIAKEIKKMMPNA